MSCSLSVSAETLSLPGVPLGTAPAPKRVLAGEDRCGKWRVVEALGTAPFDLQLRWSAGSGTGAEATVSVARSARICVYARSLRALAVNRSPEANTVSVLVSDGETPTANMQTLVLGPGKSTYAVGVPSFARSVRVDLGAPAPGRRSTRSDLTLPSLPAPPTPPVLGLLDAYGRVLSLTPLDQQPSAGVPVGAAQSVVVSAGSPSLLVRATFHLAL
ncbi:MAG: hypothetical protein EP330_08590 [Deltaproteobacteria bacterium]|nr:MAG: hypothetical protein EP330_08590 [Deltaproteobacteria bacterium]